MALGDSYATLADLKSRLAIPDTSDDTALTNALAAASRSIEGYCNRQFNLAGSATARVYVPDNYYLVTVDDISSTSGLIVQADYGFDGVFETTLTLNTDFVLEPLNGVVDGEPNWPYWKLRTINIKWWPIWIPQATVYPRPSVQVTATWGWATVPAAVKEACLMLAAETYKMKDAPYGVAGFTDYGPVRVRENPKIAAMLRRYQRNAAMIG